MCRTLSRDSLPSSILGPEHWEVISLILKGKDTNPHSLISATGSVESKTQSDWELLNTTLPRVGGH